MQVEVVEARVQAEVQVEARVQVAEVVEAWVQVAEAEVVVAWVQVVQVADNAVLHFLRCLQEGSSIHRASFCRQRLRARRAPDTTRHVQTIKVVKAH